MGKRDLSETQQAAFDELQEQLPTDLVPGFSVVTSGEVEPESPWVKRMGRMSKDLGTNAYAYFNYNVRNKDGGIRKLKRRPRRVLSAEGFPPWVTVAYAYPPPFAFYTMFNPRPVNRFVMHSFGHMWHGTRVFSKKKNKYVKGGWMNSNGTGKGVTSIVREGQTIFIPTGSDPENMAHYTRFKAGLTACLHSAAKATAHFFIDRDGNLIVVGDCNDVMFTSPGVNKKSIGVEMEEAFYVLKDTKGRKNKAMWKPGGKPAGTAGNIEYFSYSAKQMLTLSILVKKLEMIYAPLRDRNVGFSRHTVDGKSPPGYTLHDALRHGHHVDISPHFLDQKLWDAFFKLVDEHTHITASNVFKTGRYKKADGEQKVVAKPLSDQAVTAMTERLYNYAKETGEAYDRTEKAATTTKSAENSAAGKGAVQAANRTSQEVANLQRNAQQTQEPIRELPVTNLPNSSDGQQAGSDDMW